MFSLRCDGQALSLLGAATALAVSAADAQRPAMHDRVILGGRVMDPASGLNAVRNIGISGGQIVWLGTSPIAGRDTIDARGLMVAPGFIDLHAHGQDDESYRYYVMDGVTTALEMESGIGPVQQFYAEREGKARVNFGGTAAHYQARRVGTGDTLRHYYRDRWTDTSTRYSHTPTTPELMRVVRAELSRALDEGALGVGIGVAYVPGASRAEILSLFDVCAERKVLCFTHVRAGLEGLQEVLANALTTGAALHVVHVNSSSGAAVGSPNVPIYLRMINAARARGVDVTTEAYPYTASSTRLQSALYDRALETSGYDFSRIVWAATGERLTRETFIKYRQQGGIIIHLGGPDSLLYPIFRDTMVMVASDAVPYVENRGNPRLAGTFARVLGRYARDARLMSMMEALRRMTIMPAQRLEASVPQMRRKGRIGVGMDADIVVFDSARIIDRATVEEPAQYSAGFVHVLVNGVPVVRGEKLVETFPGRAIRR
jgi:N-acyl-D-aspartate/D-glutamate deacylase